MSRAPREGVGGGGRRGVGGGGGKCIPGVVVGDVTAIDRGVSVTSARWLLATADLCASSHGERYWDRSEMVDNLRLTGALAYGAVRLLSIGLI